MNNALQRQPIDGQVVPINDGRSLTAVAVREHVNLIQEVMRAVMKEGTHYGVIPGCKQPSLYKAGSEVLLTTFRIAVSVQVEDLSTADCIRYRIRTIGTHQQSGIVVGEGIGECSSDEDKYKWRKTHNKKEFDATPETRRRIKYGKSWEDMQVRTEPADVANTVLKMAKKRAQIDLTLTATAASDIFTQDVEDLPEELLQEYEPTPEERLAQRKATHDAAFAKHSESVTFIKDRIAAKDMAAVAKEWAAIPQDDQMALWLANTKGGCFTTEERRAIKEDLPKAQTEPEPA
jgi:hypothetical protein